MPGDKTEERKYLGFGIGKAGRIIRVFQTADGLTKEDSSPDALSPLERLALKKDSTPTVYHYEDVLEVSPKGELSIIYARGKDLVPFSALDHMGFLAERIADPALAPPIITFQANQTCNGKCTFCATRDYRKRPIYKGKRFSSDEMKTFMDWMAGSGGKVIELVGGGEPTIHPDFIDIAKYAGDKGLRLSVYTNGTLFAKKSGQNTALLDALADNCALLSVSLDGYSSRHLLHRESPAEKTEKVYEGIDYIAKHRDPRRMGFYNSFIVSGGPFEPANLQDLRECVERQIGSVDAMHIQSNFITNSHKLIDKKDGHDIIQGVIDDHFKDIFLYFNQPLISHFGLELPYSAAVHNLEISPGERCYRSLMWPTFESGSNAVHPCGLWDGIAQDGSEKPFGSMIPSLQATRESSDGKDGRHCRPCVSSSYNAFLSAAAKSMTEKPGCEYFLFYKDSFVRKSLQ